MPIAIVCSEFNKPVTERLFEGCVSRLQALGVDVTEMDTAWVPGAVELPLIAQRFAKTGRYEAVICLGAVIRGETSHYDYVCESVTYGCQRIALDYQLPIIFGVLTTDTLAQAWDRLGGEHGHKGVDAANTAVQMAKLNKECERWKVGPCG